jgi:hypothetical protein
MKKWFCAAAALLAAGPVFAADVATCTLGADRKTVTVTASNPYSQVMGVRSELPHGNSERARHRGLRQAGTGGCHEFRDVHGDRKEASAGYTRVKDTEANCPDPAAPPAAAKKDEDDDAGGGCSDAEDDEAGAGVY